MPFAFANVRGASWSESQLRLTMVTSPTFSVTAVTVSSSNGSLHTDGLRYQWWTQGPSNATPIEIVGATNSTLTLLADFVTPSASGTRYGVDLIGQDSTMRSDPAVLYVGEGPPPVKAQLLDSHTISMSFPTLPEVTYVLESSSSLSEPDWSVAGMVTGTGAPVSLALPFGGRAHFFRYRVP